MKVLLFGIVQDIVGENSIHIEVLDSMTIVDLQAYLQGKYPKFTELKKFAFAVNEEYANLDMVITDTDIVAIIPPVSGG